VFEIAAELRHSGSMNASRRDRLRSATIEEIKTAALEQIASAGASAPSIRGIARAIGMSPAGLYRYYTGIDDLVTDLIADAYNDLADHVAGAASGPRPARERLRDGILAYRSWCLEYPNRFLLIFGTPIPGYEAPRDGPTAAANRRIGEVFFALGAEAWESGRLVVRPAGRPLESAEEAFAGAIAPGFPPEAVGAFLSAWAHFHGIVTLEVLNQLHWIYPDAEAFYRAEVDRIVDRLLG
jgi:AcrR family transcriptional regulator